MHVVSTILAFALVGFAALPAFANDIVAVKPGTILEWRRDADGTQSTGKTEIRGVDDVVVSVSRVGEAEVRPTIPLCWGCAKHGRYDYIIDRDEYRKLWPLEIGKKVEFQRHRDDYSSSWKHTIEVVGKETLTIGGNPVETFKVIETVEWLPQNSSQSGSNRWRGEATRWWAPSVGYMVKQVSTQNRGDWQRLSFTVTDVHASEGSNGHRASAPASAPVRSALTLTDMRVPDEVKAGEFYTIRFAYEGDAGAVKRVCFPAAGGQASCWESFTIDSDGKTIQTSSRIGSPGTYTLTGYVEYEKGGETVESNQVSSPVTVR